MPADSLAALLRENADEIVTQWSRDLKAGALGKYSERPLDDLETSCRQSLEAFVELLDHGDHSKVRWVVHQEVRSGVGQGYRAAEIGQQFVGFRRASWPLVARAFGADQPALIETLARLDRCVDEALLELQDQYERAAEQKLEARLDEMEAMNRRLEELSVRDPLTGLYNRRYFMDRIAHEFQRAARHERPLSVVMLDLDLFKHVNDSYGHQVGDQVLRSVALMLVSQTRNTDIAARYGGEEFIAMLPETDGEGALRVGEKLREAVAVAPMYRPAGAAGPQTTIFCTISVGVAAYDPLRTADADQLIAAADAALYAAKNAGRNRVVGAWTLATISAAPKAISP